MEKKLTFAEYVSPGHPDKVADIISQYLLDRYLERDPKVRYAVEVMIKGNKVTLAGEVSSITPFSAAEYTNYVREAIESIGYTHKYFCKWVDVIDPWAITVDLSGLAEQSTEIAVGVNDNGWGDQGVFYGYALLDGDKYLMPKAHSYAKNLCHMLYFNAKDNGIGGLDIKTEIIMSGEQIVKIIAAVPCRTDEEYKLVKKSIYDWFGPVAKIGDYPEIILNGTGIYRCHGPVVDCGVTGRKLAVDFYGGGYAIGGGAVIKDYTKADVSLNLDARWLAIQRSREYNCSIKTSLACCIGSPMVDYCVENLETGEILEAGTTMREPSEVCDQFRLNKPRYASMHTFGLFGEFQQDKEWEKNEE